MRWQHSSLWLVIKLWTDCAYLLIKFLNIFSFHIKWIHFFFLGCNYGSSKAGWGTDYFGTFLNRRLTENYSSWGTNINFNCNMTESSIVELFGYIMWCSQWIDWSCRSVQYNSGNVPWMPWLNLSGTEWINSNLNV